MKLMQYMNTPSIYKISFQRISQFIVFVFCLLSREKSIYKVHEVHVFFFGTRSLFTEAVVPAWTFCFWFIVAHFSLSVQPCLLLLKPTSQGSFLYTVYCSTFGPIQWFTGCIEKFKQEKRKRNYLESNFKVTSYHRSTGQYNHISIINKTKIVG